MALGLSVLACQGEGVDEDIPVGTSLGLGAGGGSPIIVHPSLSPPPGPPCPALVWETPGSVAPVPPNQELISEHFGEDNASYEAEVRELEDLRQVGGVLPATGERSIKAGR